MPEKTEMTEDGMEESVYSESEVESSDDETMEEEGEDASQTLVPKSILPENCKEGDTLTFTVVSDFGEEVGVRFVGKNPGEKTATKNQESSTDQEIDDMDETEEM